MKYFRFEIPLNADGTRVSYSPGWHGTMPHCPEGKVTVVLYNDKEGYGIAQVEDCTLPKEVTSLTKADHDKVITEARAVEGVYVGVESISARPEWNPVKEEPVAEEVDDER
jgi:hypothetical protein